MLHDKRPLVMIACMAAACSMGTVANGQIYNWDTGEVIPHTEDITPQPSMNFDLWGSEEYNLRYADLSGGLDLNHSSFRRAWLDHAWFMGANLDWANLHSAELANADFSGAILTNTDFTSATLTDANLAEANMNGADCSGARLTGADFSGATVTGVSFCRPPVFSSGTGLTNAQLYSTASYQASDLHGINLAGNILPGCNLSGQDLTGMSVVDADLTAADLSQANMSPALALLATLTDADLSGANLAGAVFVSSSMTGADLQGADATGAYFDRARMNDADLTDANLAGASFHYADTRGTIGISWSSATTENTIHPDGHIHGLDLTGGYGWMLVWDYEGDIAITIDDEMLLDADATLYINLADAEWGSTISLADGVVADLEGTLWLSFTEDADVDSLVGTTFDLFDWNGSLLPGDAFANIQYEPELQWDLSDLYVGGSVTLVAVPEPATLGLLSLGAVVLLRRHERLPASSTTR